MSSVISFVSSMNEKLYNEYGKTFLEEFDLNTITLVGALTEKTKELLEVGSIEFEMDDAFFDDDDEEEEDF